MDKQGLVLNGIGKQFYGITVLSDIDFEILPGEYMVFLEKMEQESQL